MYRNVSKTQMSFKAGYSPRSTLRLIMTQEKELLNRISLGLDRFILASLKSHFKLEGLTEVEFIQTIIKGIQGLDSQMPQRQLRLVNGIHTIYQDITMGADQKVTWDMFSNYLINNVRHVKNKQQPPYTFSKSNIRSSVRFNNPISKCIYLESLQILIMYEQNSNKLYVIDPIKGQILPHSLINQPKKLTVQTSILKKQRGKTMITTKQFIIPTEVIIMDLFYINQPKFDIIICSTSDGRVRGWKYTSNNGFQPAIQPESDNLNIEHRFDSSIHSMTWDPINQVMYCGSQKGIIYSWPFKTDTQHPLPQAHSSIVTCMMYITKVQVLASGDMDGKLVLWDIVSLSKKTFKVHNRGILCMVLSQSLLLFTAGFDHQICVWNPYISGLVHKITFHTSAVVSLSFNSNYLFSLDVQNQIKITNIKTFDLVFAISPNSEKEKQIQKYNTFCLVESPCRIVACSNKLQFFDYDQDKNADLSDNIPLFNTFYIQNTFKFYACTVQRIKLWNMLTGELEQTFSGLTNYQISCVVFKPQNHYILIGDVSGYVSMLNMKSCLKVKQLPRQPSAVDSILIIPAIKQNDLLAVVSGYSIINIYKIIPEGYQLMKTFQMSKNIQISVSKYHQSLKQLIIGTNIGTIQLYDVENGKMMMSTTTLDVYSNIVFIQILEFNGLILFIQVSYMGLVSIILKLPEKFQRLKVFKINDIQNKNQCLRINSACWKHDSKLFLGDEKGCIVACNLSPTLYEIENSPNIFQLKHDIQILWKIKGHNQSIIHMNYIKKQKLLITSGYDKRIKIWRQQTGEALDNFRQQPHYNQIATPAFYWRIDNNKKYDIRNIDINQQALLKDQNIEPKDEELVFSPYWLFDKIDFKNNNPISNKYWKVSIDFRERIEKKIKNVQDLIKQLLNKKKTTKFQLIFTETHHQTKSLLSLPNTLRPSLQKHIRQNSNVSDQYASYLEKHQPELPKIQRPPKMDLVSRAQMYAQKKFRQDIASIDGQFKIKQRKSLSKTHFSLNKRKSTLLSNYRSKEQLPKQFSSRDNKLKINLSNEEMSALSRLSLALHNTEGIQRIKKYTDTVRIKKIGKK